MIRLLPQTENRWLDLPRGVKVEVRPRSTAMDAAATSYATIRIAEQQREAEAAAEAGQPLDAQGFNASNTSVLNGLFYHYQVEALARMGILRWEGVGDADGNPMAVTAASVAALVAVPEFGGAFKKAYDQATSDLVAEGNASPPTSDTATAEGESTAPGASDAPAITEEPGGSSAEAAPSS